MRKAAFKEEKSRCQGIEAEATFTTEVTRLGPHHKDGAKHQEEDASDSSGAVASSKGPKALANISQTGSSVTCTDRSPKSNIAKGHIAH